MVLLASERDRGQVWGIRLQEDPVLRITECESADVVRLLERDHAAGSEIRAQVGEAFEIRDAAGKRMKHEPSAVRREIPQQGVGVVVCQGAAVAVPVPRVYDGGFVQPERQLQERTEHLQLPIAGLCFIVIVQADLADCNEADGFGEGFEPFRGVGVLHDVQRMETGGEIHAVEVRREFARPAAAFVIRSAEQ